MYYTGKVAKVNQREDEVYMNFYRHNLKFNDTYQLKTEDIKWVPQGDVEAVIHAAPKSRSATARQADMIKFPGLDLYFGNISLY